LSYELSARINKYNGRQTHTSDPYQDGHSSARASFCTNVSVGVSRQASHQSYRPAAPAAKRGKTSDSASCEKGLLQAEKGSAAKQMFSTGQAR